MSGGFALLSRLTVTTEVHNGACTPSRCETSTSPASSTPSDTRRFRATGDTLAFWQWLVARDAARS
jgi:hypothetical protein